MGPNVILSYHLPYKVLLRLETDQQVLNLRSKITHKLTTLGVVSYCTIQRAFLSATVCDLPTTHIGYNSCHCMYQRSRWHDTDPAAVPDLYLCNVSSNRAAYYVEVSNLHQNEGWTMRTRQTSKRTKTVCHWVCGSNPTSRNRFHGDKKIIRDVNPVNQPPCLHQPPGVTLKRGRH